MSAKSLVVHGIAPLAPTFSDSADTGRRGRGLGAAMLSRVLGLGPLRPLKTTSKKSSRGQVDKMGD